jgi:hypothetical protein
MAAGAGVYLWGNPAAYETLRGKLTAASAILPAGNTTTEQASAPQPQAAQPRAAEQTAPPAAQLPPVPNVYGLVMLIRNAVLSLAQANASGNYGILRDMAAPGLQQATTVASLSENFAGLRNSKLDLGEIAVANPTLARQPLVDARGFMRLIGFFPVGEEKVNFDLVFQLIDGRWRLFGIGVAPDKTAEDAGATDKTAGGAKAKKKTAKAKSAPKLSRDKVPDDPTLLKLIRTTVVGLNQANLTGDYSVLRDTAADGFQKANTTAQLADLFVRMRGRNLDLSPIAVIDPRLFRPAAIDENGYLRLAGFFPSRPEQVNFDLAYQFSDGAWKLFGIAVNTSRATAPGNAPASATNEAAPQGGKADPAAPTPKLSPAKP